MQQWIIPQTLPAVGIRLSLACDKKKRRHTQWQHVERSEGKMNCRQQSEYTTGPLRHLRRVLQCDGTLSDIFVSPKKGRQTIFCPSKIGRDQANGWRLIFRSVECYKSVGKFLWGVISFCVCTCSCFAEMHDLQQVDKVRSGLLQTNWGAVSHTMKFMWAQFWLVLQRNQAGSIPSCTCVFRLWRGTQQTSLWLNLLRKHLYSLSLHCLSEPLVTQFPEAGCTLWRCTAQAKTVLRLVQVPGYYFNQNTCVTLSFLTSFSSWLGLPRAISWLVTDLFHTAILLGSWLRNPCCPRHRRIPFGKMNQALFFKWLFSRELCKQCIHRNRLRDCGTSV